MFSSEYNRTLNGKSGMLGLSLAHLFCELGQIPSTFSPSYFHDKLKDQELSFSLSLHRSYTMKGFLWVCYYMNININKSLFIK